MKAKLYLYFLPFILLVIGCESKEDLVPTTQVTGRWKLTEVVHTSMIAGQPDIATAPPYAEILELRADSTFRRYRSTGYDATGRYSFKKYGADDYGVLATFADNTLSYHDLPGYRLSSHIQGQVYFRLLNSNKLVESYIATDGPSFYYQKIKDENP